MKVKLSDKNMVSTLTNWIHDNLTVYGSYLAPYCYATFHTLVYVNALPTLKILRVALRIR
jgi:hypothetical protein